MKLRHLLSALLLFSSSAFSQSTIFIEKDYKTVSQEVCVQDVATNLTACVFHARDGFYVSQENLELFQSMSTVKLGKLTVVPDSDYEDFMESDRFVTALKKSSEIRYASERSGGADGNTVGSGNGSNNGNGNTIIVALPGSTVIISGGDGDKNKGKVSKPDEDEE